jgi:hypothetical protein
MSLSKEKENKNVAGKLKSKYFFENETFFRFSHPGVRARPDVGFLARF